MPKERRMQTRNQRYEQYISTFSVEKQQKSGKIQYIAIWWRGEKYNLEDYAYLRAEKKFEKWVGQIKQIYFVNSIETAENCRLKIRWMYSDDSVMAEYSSNEPRELYYSTVVDDNKVKTLRGKLVVKFIHDIPDRAQYKDFWYQSRHETENDHYFVDMDTRDICEDLPNLDPPVPFGPIGPPEKNGNQFYEGVFEQNVCYQIGDCVFIQPKSKMSTGEFEECYHMGPLYVFQITQIWAKPDGSILCEGFYFYRWKDLAKDPKIGEHRVRELYSHPQELFLSKEACPSQTWEVVLGKCDVHNATTCASYPKCLRRANQFFCQLQFSFSEEPGGAENQPGNSVKFSSIGNHKFGGCTRGDATEKDTLVDRFLEEAFAAKRPVFDVFSGAGGASLGYQEAGFQIKWALDNNPAASNTFCHNFPKAHFIHEDIQSFVARYKKAHIREGEPKPGEVFLLQLSPPCQGFSIKNRFRQEDDPRNERVKDGLALVEILQPPYVVLENVVGMVDDHEKLSEDNAPYIFSRFVEMGYQVRMGFLRGGGDGLPQCRLRVVFMACKARVGRILPPFPALNFFYGRRGTQLEKFQQCVIPTDMSALYYPTTVWETIGSLNSITDDKHNPEGIDAVLHTDTHVSLYNDKLKCKSENLYNHTTPRFNEQNEQDKEKFKQLDWFRHFGAMSTYWDPNIMPLMHPSEDRYITLAEAAAANGFFFCFRFFGTRQQVQTQIGNGFAPPTTFAIGIQIQLACSQFRTIAFTREHQNTFRLNYYSMDTVFSDEDLADRIEELYLSKPARQRQDRPKVRRVRTEKGVEVIELDEDFRLGYDDEIYFDPRNLNDPDPDDPDPDEPDVPDVLIVNFKREKRSRPWSRRATKAKPANHTRGSHDARGVRNEKRGERGESGKFSERKRSEKSGEREKSEKRSAREKSEKRSAREKSDKSEGNENSENSEGSEIDENSEESEGGEESEEKEKRKGSDEESEESEEEFLEKRIKPRGGATQGTGNGVIVIDEDSEQEEIKKKREQREIIMDDEVMWEAEEEERGEKGGKEQDERDERARDDRSERSDERGSTEEKERGERGERNFREAREREAREAQRGEKTQEVVGEAQTKEKPTPQWSYKVINPKPARNFVDLSKMYDEEELERERKRSEDKEREMARMRERADAIVTEELARIDREIAEQRRRVEEGGGGEGGREGGEREGGEIKREGETEQDDSLDINEDYPNPEIDNYYFENWDMDDVINQNPKHPAENSETSPSENSAKSPTDNSKNSPPENSAKSPTEISANSPTENSGNSPTENSANHPMSSTPLTSPSPLFTSPLPPPTSPLPPPTSPLPPSTSPLPPSASPLPPSTSPASPSTSSLPTSTSPTPLPSSSKPPPSAPSFVPLASSYYTSVNLSAATASASYSTNFTSTQAADSEPSSVPSPNPAASPSAAPNSAPSPAPNFTQSPSFPSSAPVSEPSSAPSSAPSSSFPSSVPSPSFPSSAPGSAPNPSSTQNRNSTPIIDLENFTFASASSNSTPFASFSTPFTSFATSPSSSSTSSPHTTTKIYHITQIYNVTQITLNQASIVNNIYANAARNTTSTNSKTTNSTCIDITNDDESTPADQPKNADVPVVVDETNANPTYTATNFDATNNDAQNIHGNFWQFVHRVKRRRNNRDKPDPIEID